MPVKLLVVLAAVASAAVLVGAISAARGELNTTFGSGGKVTTDFGGDETASAVALQRDGKIVVAGRGYPLAQSPSDDFLLARYTARGGLDPSFDGDGKVATDFGGRQDFAEDVKIQRDGKIVVVGWSRRGDGSTIALARYHPNGSLDSTFGPDGTILTAFGAGTFDVGYAVLLQPDGRIVVGGASRSGSTRAFALARHLPDGTLDPSFGTGGIVTTPIPGRARDGVFALAVQPGGKLVAAGGSYEGASEVVLARYSRSGVLDKSFDGDGIVVASFRPMEMVPLHVAVQRDGKIVAAGYGGVTRLAANGTVDRFFTDAANAVLRCLPSRPCSLNPAAAAIQPDGRILVAGTRSGKSNDFAVARLTAKGDPDPTYGRGGVVSTDFASDSDDSATDAVLSSDGKLTVAGGTGPAWDRSPWNFAVARYAAFGFCVVPGLRGRTLGAARLVLTRASCRIGTIERRYSSTVRKGRVISQRPRPQTRLVERSKVSVVVSRGRRP
ncbi:MAG TPA: PASTA domain-containing protein [Gaiellaceae bacterium]|nr:PASTA domain-containing protein [Gaiellaceae bacterium]